MKMVRQAFKKVSHVLFDLDGLILDTEPLYTKANQNIVSKYGKTYTSEIKQRVLGFQGPDAAKEVVKFLELPITWEEYYHSVKEQYPLVLADTELMPDTEIIYKKAISEVARRCGKVYTPAVQAKVIGAKDLEGAVTAVREMELPLTPEKFLKEYKSLALKALHTVGIMPGAERLIRHFHAAKVPMAIATSSSEDTYKIKVGRHQALFSLFSHVVTGGTDPEVKHGKPSPDIFLVCASRFKDKPKPEQCLVFEDSPNGVMAAVTAGMQAVIVPDKNIDENNYKMATLKLNSLEELRPELFGLPAFKKNVI